MVNGVLVRDEVARGRLGNPGAAHGDGERASASGCRGRPAPSLPWPDGPAVEGCSCRLPPRASPRSFRHSMPAPGKPPITRRATCPKLSKTCGLAGQAYGPGRSKRSGRFRVVVPNFAACRGTRSPPCPVSAPPSTASRVRRSSGRGATSAATGAPVSELTLTCIQPAAPHRLRICGEPSHVVPSPRRTPLILRAPSRTLTGHVGLPDWAPWLQEI